MRVWPLIFVPMLSLSACDSGKTGADAGTAPTTDTDGPRANTQEPDARASGESRSDGAVSGTGPGPAATRNTVAQQAAMDALLAAAEAAASASAADSAEPHDPAEAAEEAEWERQRTALHLKVLVLDRSSGRPLAGIRVGGGKTDADGRYEERRKMPLPKEKITAYCPSRMFLARGRQIGEAPLVVHDGRADAVIEVDATQCVEPPLRKLRMRLAGVYRWGFENSSFVPCAGMPPEAAYYERPGYYWVDMPPLIHRAIARAASQGDDDRMMGRTAYVEWLGTTTGPGQYGHMGMALYQLDVEALYKVSATSPATCRPDGFDRSMPPPPPAPER
jgi:hypothetical protein